LLLEKVMSLDFALDVVAGHDADMQAPARLEKTLLEEFRRQRAEVEAPRRDVAHVGWSQSDLAQHASRHVWWGALAMAASVLLALGLAVGHWPGSVPASNNAANQAAVSATAAASQTPSDDAEYATNFVSLPYADDPGTLDGGTVVRVTLSRAALASFGVPVADLSTGEQIPADIALSVDGVPEAIRLVASASIDQTN
jgi:hypothetical protein